MAKANGGLQRLPLTCLKALEKEKLWYGGRCLILSWINSLRLTPRTAQTLIVQWCVNKNAARPHSALGYRPLAPASILPTDQSTMTL